jgi:site-specific recombinase XerD
MYISGQSGEGMFEQTESQKTAAANELKHLSESELLDVLECARKASSRDHALLVVAFTHGLRNQEVARLRLAVRGGTTFS